MKNESTGYSPFQLTFDREVNLSSMLSTTPKVKYEELLNLWKRRHGHYLQKAKEKIDMQKIKYKKLQDSRISIPQGTWNIILRVGTNDIDDRLGSLQNAFAAASYQCDDCLERFELNLIQSRIQRLDKQRSLLNQRLGKKRNKRGFFNFIGDVSKHFLVL